MDERKYNFYDRDRVAKLGEDEIISILPTKGFANVKNVREVKEYQEQDVDFLAFLNGKECKLEVKTDETKYTNIFYEVISNDKKYTVGCMRKTQADYLIYYFINPSRNATYVFDMPLFREWAEKYIKENNLLIKSVQNENYRSWGYLIPIEEIENKPFVEVWESKKHE